LTRLLSRALTLFRLGLANLARVGLYRIRLRLGVHPVQRIAAATPGGGQFFGSAQPRPALTPSPVWRESPWAFGRDLGRPSQSPPNWHANILTGAKMPDSGQRWDRLPQFDDHIGEIKTIWEASRFDFVTSFAQAAVSGDSDALDRLNHWLDDWCIHNPPFSGPNWMCAQEASIRVMKLALSAYLLDPAMPISPAMGGLIENHLRRIEPTLSYAIGQDNNHATSEAAALFIGGLWQAAQAVDTPARRLAKSRRDKGFRLLARLVRRLVSADGGFAQYSVVYHRLMLDTLSLCELFRRHFGSGEWPDDVQRRIVAAADWLDATIIGGDGDAPNYGSNDGAWLLPVGQASFRDFRPSLALAYALYSGRRRFAGVDSADGLLDWLRIEPAGAGSVPDEGLQRMAFPESGLFHCAAGSTRAMLVAPRPRFRPHQCDPLHLDIWQGGRAVFCDSGTFSYAKEAPPPDPWLGSIRAHNSLAIGNGEPMPRLGRFLLGDWLRADVEFHDAHKVDANCRWAGCRHRRVVEVDDGRVVVRDTVTGTADKATLLWKTQSSGLRIDGTSIEGDGFRMAIEASGPIDIDIIEAWVSPTYLRLAQARQIRVGFLPVGTFDIVTTMELTAI
jgi:Heparinase II/III-like protein